MTAQNKTNLNYWITALTKRPIYSSLQILSKGNIINILKEKGESYWMLLIPSKPLEEQTSIELNNSGFRERHSRINFTKTLHIDNENVKEQIVEEIDYIFHHFLKVEKERPWRFEIQSGMQILKDPRPILTKSQLRHRNKAKLNRKFYWIGPDLILSIPIGLIIGLGLIKEHKIILFNNVLTIFCSWLVLYGIIKTLSLLQKLGKSFNLKRLFSDEQLEFFLILGFERKGQRLTGKNKGFKTDIYFNGTGLTEVAIIHSEIPWEKVTTISQHSKKIFKNRLITLRQYNSKIKLQTRNSEKILKALEEFIDTLIEQGYKPT